MTPDPCGASCETAEDATAKARLQGVSRTVDTEHLLSISDASQMGLSAVVRRAEAGEPILLMRGSKAVATVLPVAAYFAWNGDKP